MSNDEYKDDISIEFPMPSEETKLKQIWEEVDVTIYQVIFVVSSVILDLLEIKITLHRLNPPRLLISQSFQYFSMIIASYWKKFVKSYRIETFRDKEEDQSEDLSPLSALTLTLLDISCDASTKIALLLSPREKIESFFGFLPLLQTVISYFILPQQINILSFISVSVQTIGYILVTSNVVGRASEPTPGTQYEVLGIPAGTAGYIFAALSLFLRCLNLTMTQLLSASVHLSATSFCQATGVWGLIITSVYHFIILQSQKEKIVFLSPSNQIYTTMGFFVAISAFNHYAGFWLILHTSAVEYSRVVMCSNLMMFYVRHEVFREEGATFGYATVPLSGIIITVIGFALFCVVPPSVSDRELLTQQIL